MTKQEILDEFNDINFVYNNSSKYETLSTMLDELLNEQEAKKVIDIVEFSEGMQVGRCPSCGRSFVNLNADETKYCKSCGQKVKWNG